MAIRHITTSIRTLTVTTQCSVLTFVFLTLIIAKPHVSLIFQTNLYAICLESKSLGRSDRRPMNNFFLHFLHTVFNVQLRQHFLILSLWNHSTTISSIDWFHIVLPPKFKKNKKQKHNTVTTAMVTGAPLMHAPPAAAAQHCVVKQHRNRWWHTAQC